MGVHLGMEADDVDVTRRVAFLESEVGAICKSLDDPRTSKVVIPGSAENPIINDVAGKVNLYLNNLEMLWQLGNRSPQQASLT
jgi:hypothetical protein